MTDLNTLIGNSPVSEATAEDDLSNKEAISSLVDNMMLLSQAFETFDRTIAGLSNRMDTLEKHLSYLLTKDPEVGPKMIEIANKLKEEAEAQASTKEMT